MKPQAIGGHARAAKLSPERRKEIAVNAIRARWAKRDAEITCKPSDDS
jgi:hypothetical protein